MEIIAHRGMWKKNSEKNKFIAFERACQEDMGTETDFRDYNQELVISHDIPNEDCMRAEEFFYMNRGNCRTLALNIKSDGIQKLLKELIDRFSIENYFCFDMSIPDTVLYIKENIHFFTRESEYEPIPAFYKNASGIWLDGFLSDDWITEKKIQSYIDDGKRICIVSPELHGREYYKQWEIYKHMKCIESNQLILCTDFPVEARRFFYE